MIITFNHQIFRVCSYGFPKGRAFRSDINVCKQSPRNPQNNPIAEVEIFAVIDFMAFAVVPPHKQPQKTFSVRP
jgi:hypothetical protein